MRPGGGGGQTCQREEKHPPMGGRARRAWAESEEGREGWRWDRGSLARAWTWPCPGARAAGAQSVELRWDFSSRGPGPVVIPALHRLGATLGLPEDTSCVKRGAPRPWASPVVTVELCHQRVRRKGQSPPPPPGACKGLGSFLCNEADARGPGGVSGKGLRQRPMWAPCWGLSEPF